MTQLCPRPRGPWAWKKETGRAPVVAGISWPQPGSRWHKPRRAPAPQKKIFSPLKMGKPQKKDRTTRFITNVYIILVYISISPLSPLNKNKIYSIYHSTSHLSRNLTGKIIEINGAFSTLTPEGNHPKWEGGYFGTFLGVGYAFFDEYPLSFGNLRGFWKWIYRWLWWSAKKCWCSVAILEHFNPKWWCSVAIVEKNPKGIMSENRIQPSKGGDDPSIGFWWWPSLSRSFWVWPGRDSNRSEIVGQTSRPK